MIPEFNDFRRWAGGLSRRNKKIVLIALDVFALTIAAWAAYILRLGWIVEPDLLKLALMFAAPLIAIPVFISLGLYRSVVRYLPDSAVWTIASATTVSTLLWVALIFVFQISLHSGFPRSVPAIYGLLSFLFVAGSRFGIKMFIGAATPRDTVSPVLIYGAGSAGAQLALALSRVSDKFVVGFIDDNTSLQDHDVAGIRVYSPSSIPSLIENVGVKEIVLSMPSVNSSRRREIVTALSGLPVRIRTLPSLTDLATGRYMVSQIREVRVDDILGRSAVPADLELLTSMIEGRTLLVSGAGGSIGSELCKLIATWKPRLLVLLEANEFALYSVHRRLQKETDALIIPVLGSVTDEGLVRRTLQNHSIQVVFHAAAHKHVPMVEANVLEGVRNNVFGTETIAKAAFEVGVENFVLVSTDKAVRPSNVMGATKRWAELITRYYAGQSESSKTGQKFCSVRFGNVLGSNGSVVPLFKEQIADGGPVTVTDPEMTRYFMSIQEAAELIVQAGALCKGGDTFLLDMGDPVRIVDLAENMIRLAGLTVCDEKNPDGDISISYIGRRPGEKLHEELFYDPASAKPTRHPKIARAQQSSQGVELASDLAELSKAVAAGDERWARRVLYSQARLSSEPSDETVIALASRTQ